MTRITIHKALTSLAVAAGCFLMTSGIAAAQVTVGVAEVPFSFTANTAVIQAGRVTIQRQGVQTVLLKGSNGGAVFCHLAVAKNSGEGRLVFSKEGGRYILTEIDQEGGYVTKVPVGARDRELLKVAKADEKIEVTLVASR